MATIIGGNGTGTLDSSLYLLNRTDTTGTGSAGHDEQVYINVSNGNLTLGHLDEFLPSETNNFLALRTYNSRGQFTTANGQDWMLSEFSRLSVITAGQIVVLNGDGSQFTFNYDPSAGVYRSVDGNGAYETISFDPRTGNYSLVQSNQTAVTYDFTGRLLQSKDTNGNTVTYNYDLLGRLSSIGDNSGHRLSFIYQFGNLIRIQDEAGTVFASYGYLGNRLVSVTDRGGETTSYAYNLDGTLGSVTLPAGPGETVRTLRFTYSFGPGGPQVATFTDAQGAVTRFNYNFTVDFLGRVTGGTTTVTDALGQVTAYSFDSKGEITNVRDAQGFNTVYGYDANENLTSVIDANGDAILRSDSVYFRNLRRDLGIVEASTGQGKLISELSAADVTALRAHFTTRLTYDSKGNVASRTDGSGNLTAYTYTAFNKIASATSGNGNTTLYSYDSKQNLIRIQAGNGDLTRLSYDSFGNLTQKTLYLDETNLTDPSKQEITQYFYDGFGNNVKTIDAQGNTTLTTFDHFGNRLSQVDGRGNVTSYTYDSENRLRSITDALGNTTLNFYDAVGNRIAVQDSSGHSVTYVYSANNLLIAIIDPPADPSQSVTRRRTTSYTYDVVGNRTSTTDAEGRTTTYTYDAVNRLLSVKTPTVTDSSGNPVSYTSTYGYDAVGNRITFIDNNGNRTDTVYNSNNLVRRVTDASGHITEYAYDADLNQVSIVVGAELGATARQVMRFDYDQRDRLVGDTDALGYGRHYAYDGANNRIAATDANGNTTDYSFDRDNRLLTVTKPAVIDPTTGQPVRYTVQYQYDANGNQIAATDENGHTVRMSFDKDDRAVLVQDANGVQTVFTYDSRGNRTSVQVAVQAHLDTSGRVVVDSKQDAQIETYTYDEFNQVVSTTDGVGNALVSSDSALYIQMRQRLGVVDSASQGKLVAQLTAADVQALIGKYTERYTYDRVGNHTTTTDHLGRTTSVTYDRLDRVVATTDALGQRTTSAYDGDGNMVSRTDALGHTTRYSYDAVNRLMDTTDALGVVVHRTYDRFGNIASTTAASGTADARTTRYLYDLDNRLVTSIDALQISQTYSYDAVGNRLRVTDGKGQATRYVYDALNRNISIIDPLGFQVRFVYDGVGNKLSLVDANGGITRFTYDAGNREIQMQDAEGHRTVFAYEARGNRVSQTTAAGTAEQEMTSYEYDAENHLTKVTDTVGNITTRDYDVVYNVIRTKDANGHVTSYAFDALNREILITDAAGGLTRYAYDAVGNRLSVTDSNGHVTSYAYDARNQQIRSTDANNFDTVYGYDWVGNQVSVTHAANTPIAAKMIFTYDLNNRLVGKTDALGYSETTRYDADGNASSVTDALGHTTSYAYDADERLSSVTDPLGNVTLFKYDANGNRVQVIDPRGFATTTYYGANNEVLLSVDNVGYATSFTYDENGNILSETLYATALTLPVDPSVQPTPVTSGADRTTRFAYDNLNRLVTQTDGEGFVTKYVYDAVGNRTQVWRALDRAGTTFEITRSYYDAVNREIARLSPEGYLSTFQYDPAGNRIAQTQYDQIVAPPSNGSVPQPNPGDSGRTTRFDYDADNRLVHTTNALGVVTTFGYDARGNRTSMIEASGTADARTTEYRYDAADRYIETTDALQVVTHLDLDPNGNLIARHEAYGTLQERIFRFAYDANDRVIWQTDAFGVITQTGYDAAGNTVSVTVAANTTAPRTARFSYDGNGHQTKAVDTTGGITTYAYDAAGDQIQVTEAVGLPESRTNSFQYDRAGRLISATDALGTITQYRYDGAGNKLETIQAAGTPQERHTFYTYDLNNRVVRVKDPLGAVTQYQYDAQGNQTQIIDANGGVQANTFDALGNALTSVSAAGVLTKNSYDLRGNLVSTEQSFLAGGSDYRKSTYSYDRLDRKTRVTDAEGFSTSITYDAFGNQVVITHGEYLVSTSDPTYSSVKAAQAFPQTTRFLYDADDRMLSMTDAERNTTSYAYDDIGNRVSTTDANGHTTRYEYDLLNRVVREITPDGGITQNTYDHVGNKIAQDQLQSGLAVGGVWLHTSFQYDANGNLTSETDPTGVITRYSYDAMGNLLSRTAAAGTGDARTVQMEYDLDSQKTADIDALGNRTTYVYDAIGNRIKVTDPLGHVAHFYYDRANRLQEVVDPQGYVNTFAYDSVGNLTQIRVHMTAITGPVDDRTAPVPVAGSLDRITNRKFDRANRKIEEIAPDGSITRYSYDAAGNKVIETQFANTSAPRTLSYVYDRDDRLVTFRDVDGSVTTFTYDLANNKTSQTIYSASDPTRTKTYTYDENNREISETFDPSGLAIVQSFSYDHLGNVLAKTDGNGHTSTFTYDLDNREVTQTDALGNTATTGYDSVGNVIATTDARGNTTDYVYDAANRLVKEIKPLVLVYTISGGFTQLRPVTTHAYDANGNEVQTTDANGGVTTRYYDGNSKVIGQISADNVLTAFTYDAAGERVSQTLYMTRLNADAQDPSIPPGAPAGDSQLTTYNYDLMGRLMQVTYPPARITSLVNANTANPSSITITQQVTERYVYDAFGNVVENYDRNGNRTLSYYDAKDRKVASVDAFGYLTQWDYDQQGNVLEQRAYAKALDNSALRPDVPPTPPTDGEVYITDIEYDAASRKVREIAPQIRVFDPNTQTSSDIRPTTTYTYDNVGNELTRTLAAGTAQAVTEYSYYDADNRRVALIDSGRVLATFSYDENGNVVVQKRYFSVVDAGIDLTQLTGTTDFAGLVSADANHDEKTEFTFDALGRQTVKSDVLTSGTLTKRTEYDALSNVTWAQNEDLWITQASYDGVGRVVQSISPDNSGTQYQYDAAGNRILIYTGVLTGGAPTPATDVSASLGSQVTLTWNTQGSSLRPLQTWVVYDTVSHQSLADYTERTATLVSTEGRGKAALSSAATGATLYFRVVTRDGAGNETWTAEQSLTVPPRLDTVSVAQPDPTTIVVTARFDAGAANPQIVYGASGNLNQTVVFVLQSDGSYQATLSGVTNPGALSFALQWQDSSGNQYSTSASTFAAAADQVGVTSNVSQAQIVNGGNTTYTLSVGTRVPSAYAAGLTALQVQWRVAGSGNAFAATAVTGTSSGQGYQTFNAVLGNPNNLTAGTYEIVLTGIRADGTSVELDHFTFDAGPSAMSVTRGSVSWAAPPVGNDQLVIIDGQNAPSSRDRGRIVAADRSSASSADYAAYYGQDSTDAHTLNVSSTALTVSIPDPDPTQPPKTVVTGYDMAVQATLSAGEAANINGGLHLAWRAAGSGTSFPNDVVVPSSGTNTFATTLSNVQAGQYDLKLYYLDAQGNQVIVEWRRIDAATSATTPYSYTGHSLTVLAQESGGTLTTDAQGVLAIAPGVYTGALDVGALSSSLALSLTPTGNAGGSLKTDGRATGYFTEIQYDALNYKIASNEGDGLWRQYGVDGNGNVVQTELLGDRSSPDYEPTQAITTYTAFDARNRKIAAFGAPVAGPGNGGVVRPVDRYVYNVLDKVTAHTDALGNTTTYAFNALGTQIAQTDPYGATTETRIDQFGNITAQVSPIGNHTLLKFYDLQGRLVKEHSAQSDETSYAYDAFGRMTTRTDGRGDTTKYTYDQRDRLVSQTDSLGNQETFAYDGRNNRISTKYPLNQRTDQVYDSLGRVVDTEVYLSGQPTHSRTAYDAYGNVIAETDAEGRTKTHVYGAFGRLLDDIDEDGNIIAYNYDVYGRRTNEYDPNGVSDPSAPSDPSGAKDIQKTFDQAGRISSIRDLSTGVSTTYTYDLLGNRLSEAVTTPGNAHNRNVSYEYDALGRLVRWKDAVTGDNLNTWYDAEGNVYREFTDLGYDPLGENANANPNYRYIDHFYAYDADRRVLFEYQRKTDSSGIASDSIVNGYKYDRASNRVEWDHENVVVTYTYDKDNRVLEGDYHTGTDLNKQVWSYDAMGNVVSYKTYKNGDQVSSTVTTYNEANRSLTSDKDGQITTQVYDKSLRITQTVLSNDGKSYYYNYSYFGDGREKSVQAYGDANGGSVSTYDANKIRVRVDLGQGDNQSRPEYKTFVADNEGHILYEFHDDGKSSANETREFLYANGNPVGENTRGTDGQLTLLLDTGSYAQIQNLGDSIPGANLTYTVRDGDTLQGIASQMYGNPSLWFVIADANGLSASDVLRSGTALIIPNTVKIGSITADNHKVYSESDIVGSTLPNLKTPPPPHHGGCGSILAIIIIVVIAVVAVIATAGLATVLLGGAAAAASASTAATVGFYALAGLAVGAIASVVQQGLFIALHYQKEFSWREVAFGAAAGALAGAAGGVAKAADLAAKAGSLTSLGALEAKISVAALDTLKAASDQIFDKGKITSWTGLAVAAVGGYAAEGEAIAGTEASVAGSSDALHAAQAAQTLSKVTRYVSPWVQLAEKSLRHQEIKAIDWANAVGGTLSLGVTDLFGKSDSPRFGESGSSLGERLRNAGLQLGTNALVAGAVSHYNKQAGEDYLFQSIGREIADFFIPEIVSGATGLFGMGSHKVKAGTNGAAQQSNTSQQAGASTADAAARDGHNSSYYEMDRPQHGGPYVDESDFARWSPESEENSQSDSDAGGVSAGSAGDSSPDTQSSDEADAGSGSPDKTGNKPKAHKVKSGETLSSILHSNNPAKIGMVMWYNHMDNTTLKPNETVLIPDLANYDELTVDDFRFYGQQALAMDKIAAQAAQAHIDRAIDWGSSREFGTVRYKNGTLGQGNNEYHLDTPIGLDDLPRGPALSVPPAAQIVAPPVQSGTEPNLPDLQPSVPNVQPQSPTLMPPQVQPPADSQHWWNDVGDWMDRNHVGTRVAGGLQTLGGVLEADLGAALIAAGTVTAEFGVGFALIAAGGGLVGLGADQASAGVRKMWSGADERTLLSQGIQRLGATRGQADAADASINFVASMWGTGWLQSMKPPLLPPPPLTKAAPAAEAEVQALTTEEFLVEKGITDPQLRRQIEEAGLRTDLLSEATTPTTLARFQKLFVETFQEGKRFAGRLGNVDTRVQTINRAAEIEQGGAIPRFEYPVDVAGGGKRWVDLVAVDANTGQPTQFFQFVKENAAGAVIRSDEINAAAEIERALGLPQGTVQLVNTNRH